jgi:acyl-CoA thioesterase
MTGAAPSPAPHAAEAEAAQRLAEAVRDAMWQRDRASQMLGLQILAIAPGRAVVQMVVREDMLNGHDTCHGGIISTLADSCFAFACNSRNALTVASGFTIDLLAPARLGDVLTAVGAELHQAGRTGVYDVDVRNQRDQRIAAFRGRSHALHGRQVVATPEPSAT